MASVVRMKAAETQDAGRVQIYDALIIMSDLN